MPFDLSDTLNWREYLKLLIGLIAIIGLPSSLPIFLSLTKNFTAEEKRRIAFLTTITVVITLTLFTFLGTVILNMFGISIESFRIAGGILILLSGLSMMNPQPPPKEEPTATPATNKLSIAIVPLAIPLLAGPGAISTVIVYAQRYPKYPIAHQVVIASVILIVGIITYFGLRFAPRLGARLGESGTEVFNRVMGLIVCAIAVEFIFGGIVGYVTPLLK